MTDKKITQLSTLTSPSPVDLIPIVHDPSGIPTTRSITVNDLLSATSSSVVTNGITLIEQSELPSATASTIKLINKNNELFFVDEVGTNLQFGADNGGWIYLQTPLTSTSWDGDSHSTEGDTLLNFNTVFGVPVGAKAVQIRLTIRDSGSGTVYYMTIGPNSTWAYSVTAYTRGGDILESDSGVVPLDNNCQADYRIVASGTNTLDAFMEVWGYYLPPTNPGMTAYSGQWKMLDTPLTSTNWDASGEYYGTVAKTKIDLSSEFGVPEGVRAVYLSVGVRDSSSASSDTYMILSSSSVAGAGVVFQPSSVNNRYNREAVTIPCNVNGDIYYQIQASGSATFQAALQIYGYYYDNLDVSKWTYLITPLTSTSWDGDSFSTTGRTLIDLSAVFGVPAGAKAVLTRLIARDSASASSTNCWVGLGGTSEAWHTVIARPEGKANDAWDDSFGIVPCNENGDIYYQIASTGTNTIDIYLQIYGYLLEDKPTFITPQTMDIDGWVNDTDTWTYVSGSTFSVTGDKTSRFGKGVKIKCSNSGIKYFYIAKSEYISGSTLVTVAGGSDYALANAVIQLPRYSRMDSPAGFPEWFNWSPSIVGYSASPTDSVYRFNVTGKAVNFIIRELTGGTSNSTAVEYTPPIRPSIGITNLIYGGFGLVCNDNVVQNAPGRWTIDGNTGGNIIFGLTGTAAAGFSASGLKRIPYAEGFYEF